MSLEPPAANGSQKGSEPSPSWSLETITPSQAAEWLEKYNTANYRKLGQTTVKKYADLLRRGEWPLTSASISFGADGRLLDGQHRLAACALADVPLTTFVVRGITSDAELYIDTGKPRSFSDYLRYLGEKNSTALATTLNILYFMLNEKPESLVNKSGAVPAAELLEVLDKHPQIRDAVSWAGSARKQIPGITQSYLAAARYLFARVEDPDPVSLAADVDWFFARLADGTELAQTDPVRLLREVLHRNSRTTMVNRMHSSVIFALTIKAWNATRDGRAMQILTYRPGGRSREQFPMPK
jgi:hypothetical protein